MLQALSATATDAMVRLAGIEVALLVFGVFTYLVFSAGASLVLIAVLAMVGWITGTPLLTTWSGSVPMAPLTAIMCSAMGASLMLCASEARSRRRFASAGALSALSLAASVFILILRGRQEYSPLEGLGFAPPVLLNGALIDLVSPLTAAGLAAASIALITQLVPWTGRKVRLVVALASATVLFSVGLASVVTSWFGYPVLSESVHVPAAVNAGVALLLLGIGVATLGIRLSDQSSRRARSAELSWRPLGLAFVALTLVTIVASYAFYRQEEREMRSDAEARLENVLLVRTSEVNTAGAAFRPRAVPNTEWSLMWAPKTDFKEELWARLRWVLTFALLLLVSAAAILTLVWNGQRTARYLERTALAEALRLQAVRERELVARSPAVLYRLLVAGTQFVPVDMSANVERILGYTVGEALDPAWFQANLFPGDREEALAAVAALDSSDELVNEFRFLRRDASVVWVLNQMTVTRRHEDGLPAEITGAWHDITSRHQAETALRESEERLRLALAAAKQGLWDLDLPSGDAIVSSEYATMLGYDPADFHETRAKWVERAHPDERESLEQRFRDYIDGRIDTYLVESRQRTASGDWKWILSRGSLIARSPDGRPLRMLGIHTDIDARKTAELRSEALLKEVHHRVKNNLQVISSLLRLERDRHEDATVKSAMVEMQMRILSMALLHEALYQSNDLARVDLGAYLADLAQQVFRSSAPSTGAVTLRLNLSSVLVDLDHAIPCGLLANEVLSNCLKHAFPGGAGGTVTVDLQPEAGGPAYVLRISDTGVGLPADFETRRSASLGVHLIQALARQLKARLVIDPGPGASFSIAFATNGTVPSEENA